MSQVLLQAAGLGALRSSDLQLAPGRYVVLGNEPEPLAALIAILGGSEPPSSGRALVAGAAPSASPGARRAIAALFADEALPPAPSVVESVSRALAARGDSSNAERLLTEAGLRHWAELAPRALEPRQTRSVALALALAHERAALLALHEPLSTSLEREQVLGALDRHTERGAIVLAATTSSADAAALGGHWLSVELGRVRSDVGAAPRLGAGPWQRVLVEAQDARALSALLNASPLGLAAHLGSEPQQLEVSGPALDVTVREIIALARQHQIELGSVSPKVPPVDVLMAARAGFARGAYEAARGAALSVGAPAPFSVGGAR